jgi:hypothetical protein
MTEPIEPAEDTATWSQEPEPEPLPKGEVDSEPAAEDDVSDDELDPRTRAYVAKLKKESQGLRARLRDAEEAVGAASARENVHTREAVAAAAAQAGLIDGNDLFIAHDPDEFLDEQFRDVVGDRVAEATQALLASKPYLGRPVGAPPSQRPLEGLWMGAAPEPKPQKTPSWSSALHGQ